MVMVYLAYFSFEGNYEREVGGEHSSSPKERMAEQILVLGNKWETVPLSGRLY